MFARDGIHLSEEGMKIVVTNIKFAIRRSLELENMRRRRSVQTNANIILTGEPKLFREELSQI
jgi:hypothetical protein